MALNLGGKKAGTAAPAPAAARPAAAAAAPKPAMDSAALDGIKLKIDALEKNLLAQLEKRIGEMLKAAVPAGPPPPIPVERTKELISLSNKLDDLQHRLADFSHAATLSAAQLKTIEESKVTSARELEELSKTVREYQRHTDLNRQFSGQLDRVLPRAEEMEKKLMEFYSSVLALEGKRQDDAASAGARTAAALDVMNERLAQLERRIMDNSPADELRAANEDFLRRARDEGRRQAEAQEAFRRQVEEAVKKISASTPGGELRAAQEEFFVKAEVEQRRLQGEYAASMARMNDELKASAQSVRQIFEEQVKSELEQQRVKFAAETEAMRRDMGALLDDSRRFLAEQAMQSTARVANFEEVARANVLRAEGVEASLETAAARQAQALEDFSRRMRAELAALVADQGAAAKAESDARFDKFSAKYADALLTVTFVETFRASIAESLEKLDSYAAHLDSFVKEVSPGQLEKAAGVSGMIVRRQFTAMTSTLETLRAESGRLRGIRAALEEKFSDIFKGK